MELLDSSRASLEMSVCIEATVSTDIVRTYAFELRDDP